MIPQRDFGNKYQSHLTAFRVPHGSDNILAFIPAQVRHNKQTSKKPPSSRLPQPQPQTCSSLHVSCTTSLAQRLSAQAPPPLCKAPWERVLPHHRLHWLSGLGGLSRLCARGEGAATASPRAVLVPPPNATASGGSSRCTVPARVPGPPGPPGQGGEPTRWQCSQAPFPSHPGGPATSSRPRRLPAAILCAAAATQIQ